MGRMRMTCSKCRGSFMSNGPTLCGQCRAIVIEQPIVKIESKVNPVSKKTEEQVEPSTKNSVRMTPKITTEETITNSITKPNKVSEKIEEEQKTKLITEKPVEPFRFSNDLL